MLIPFCIASRRTLGVIVEIDAHLSGDSADER